jgi:hypothetical protein
VLSALIPPEVASSAEKLSLQEANVKDRTNPSPLRQDPPLKSFLRASDSGTYCAGMLISGRPPKSSIIASPRYEMYLPLKFMPFHSAVWQPLASVVRKDDQGTSHAFCRALGGQDE